MKRMHNTCTNEGCEREHHARGLCKVHWNAAFRKSRRKDAVFERRVNLGGFRQQILDALANGPLSSADLAARFNRETREIASEMMQLDRSGKVHAIGQSRTKSHGKISTIWALPTDWGNAPPAPPAPPVLVRVQSYPDTLTGLMLGDPPFERSALFQRQMGAAE